MFIKTKKRSRELINIQKFFSKKNKKRSLLINKNKNFI